MIFDLAEDFRDAVGTMPKDHPRYRLVDLLEEAIRQDTHFIARHPTTLFQCMWNTCWWYDCAEAARHYEEPAGGWRKPPPWEQPSPRLSELLRAWRTGREAIVPGHRWLRALRPPSVHLNGGQRMVLRGHSGWVMSVAYSPDGERIVSGCQDGSLAIWDARSGVLLQLHRVPGGSVEDVAYSPNSQRITIASEDGGLRTFDADSVTMVHFCRGHTRPSRPHKYPNGALDRFMQAGQSLNRLKGTVVVKYSTDGSRLVSGSDDTTVRVWDAQSGNELKCLCGHSLPVTSLCCSPDGRRLASGSEDNTIRVWDMHTGQEVFCLRGHQTLNKGGGISVCWSSDGRLIASGGGRGDATVRIWDAHTGEQLQRFHEPAPLRAVTSVAFSPDGKRIATGYWDNGGKESCVRILDAQSGEELCQFSGYGDSVTSAAFSPNGRWVAGGSRDHTVRVWDTTKGVSVMKLCGHIGRVYKIAFSPDGRRVATTGGAGDPSVRIWDAHRGVQLRCFSGHCWNGHPALVTSVKFSPDGRWLAGGGHDLDASIRVWDAETGSELRCLNNHKGSVLSLAFSLDGLRIASGSQDKTVRVWDTETGRELLCLSGHADEVLVVLYSTDGASIFSGSTDGAIRMWDAKSGNLTRMWQGDRPFATLVAWAEGFQFCATVKHLETEICSAKLGATAAWYPLPIWHLLGHSGGPTWAGSSGTYLVLFTLEGAGAADTNLYVERSLPDVLDRLVDRSTFYEWVRAQKSLAGFRMPAVVNLPARELWPLFERLEGLEQHEPANGPLLPCLICFHFEFAMLFEAVGRVAEAAKAWRACHTLLQRMRAAGTHLDPALEQLLARLDDAVASGRRLPSGLCSSGVDSPAVSANLPMHDSELKPVIGVRRRAMDAAEDNTLGTGTGINGVPEQSTPVVETSLSDADQDIYYVAGQRNQCSDDRNRGQTLFARGDTSAAMEAYEAALRICERMAKAHPTDPEWRRLLAISQSDVADVLRHKGDLTGALTAYRRALVSFEQLATQDPTSNEHQHSVAVGHGKIGHVLRALKDSGGAIMAFRAAGAVFERLGSQHPDNEEFQRGLAISYSNAADLLLEQADTAAALQGHRASLAVFERLAGTNPTSATTQRDLAISYFRLAVVANQTGNVPDCDDYSRRCYQTILGMKQAGMQLDRLLGELFEALVRGGVPSGSGESQAGNPAAAGAARSARSISESAASPLKADDAPRLGPDAAAVLTEVQRLLDAGKPRDALSVLNQCPVDSNAARNARAVCLMRMNAPEVAVDILRVLVETPNRVRFLGRIPATARLNLATALLMTGDVSAARSLLVENHQNQDPGVARLREVITREERTLTLWQWVKWCLGGNTRRPIRIEFPPGQL